MKRKLLLGLGLLLFIFAIGTALTLYNLRIVRESQRVVSMQDVIVDKVNDMLFQIKGAQFELYRHKAGYSRDINAFVDHVLGLEENLLISGRDYSTSINNSFCNDCHPVREQMGSYGEMLKEVRGNLQELKMRMSMVMLSRELHYQTENEAIEITFRITKELEKIKHIALNMKEKLKSRHDLEASRAMYAITASSLIGILLAFLIVNVLFRSINRPLALLLIGIKRIAAGDFNQRVEIMAADEIGEVAGTFNKMADELKAATRQKDRLLEDLRSFNLTLERKVSEVTAELIAANESMRRNEILAVIGTLAAGVSHELSTPLGTILSFVQIFKKRFSCDDELREDIALIEHELLRCKKIVGELLGMVKFSQSDSIDTDVNETINEALNLLRYQPAMKNISLQKALDPKLPRIKADRWQLKQVFINLLMNAIQAMPGGGTLTIRTSVTDKDRVEITLADTGKGIAPAEQLNIFKPFFTTKKAGSGLGLAITHDIVAKHGGEINVQSTPGRGTMFTISLPTHQARGVSN